MEQLLIVAKCGLFCTNCNSYKKQKCKGCEENTKATWCKVRTCCLTKQIPTCANCDEYNKVKNCKKLNNTISKIIGFLLNSDRIKCISKIKETGLEKYKEEMKTNGLRTIKRR